MPTGYTANIEKGISFKEYALDCARAFGALISMRDMPSDAEIPNEIKPTDYYSKQLKKTEDELKRINNLSLKECNKEANKEYAEACNAVDKNILRINNQEKLYREMLSKAMNYKSPSVEHDEYKNFMIDQIEESIKFDCDTSYYKYPNLINGEEWKNLKKKELYNDISYYTKQNIEEIQRAESKTKWIQQLLKSLE